MNFMDDQPTVPCGLCGTPTPMLGTKRCDACWELETRIQQDPDLAEKILERTGRVTASHQQDVWAFQEKFGQLVYETPGLLTQRKLKERVECMLEELLEFMAAAGMRLDNIEGTHSLQDVEIIEGHEQDLPEQADALVDLVYFALGTANMLGLPWQKLWNDVQRANMAKERGIGKRGHLVDCVKPECWEPPKTLEILVAAGYNQTDKEERDDPEHLS